MKGSRVIVLCCVMLLGIMLGGCDLALLCEPAGLELTEQSGHLTYYFPAREEFGTLADGSYAGRIFCGIDQARVKITVEDDVITGCDIIFLVMSKHLRDMGLDDDLREEAPERFLDSQSPQFDAISGATGSTHLFKICVTRALWQAAGQEDPMTECLPLVCR